MQTTQIHDEWGEEHVAVTQTYPSAPDRYINSSDMRTLLIAFSEFSPAEQKVFILQYCHQILSPSKIAFSLGWRSRGAIKNVQNRINKKLRLLRVSMRGAINPDAEGE